MSLFSVTLRSVFSTFLLVFVAGCYPLQPGILGNKNIDETRNAAWWGDSHPNEMLQIRDEVLLNNGELTRNASRITDGYDSYLIFGKQITVEMFKANPHAYWSELHLLTKGTRLRCVKLERFYSTQSRGTYVTAEILDGDCKGKPVILGFGRPDMKGSFRLDTRFVEPVQ